VRELAREHVGRRGGQRQLQCRAEHLKIRASQRHVEIETGVVQRAIDCPLGARHRVTGLKNQVERIALRARSRSCSRSFSYFLREDQQPESAESGVADCCTSECGFDRDHFLLLWRQARPIRAFHAAAGGAGGAEDASERTATREEDLSPQG
jgi:hypothetical protein